MLLLINSADWLNYPGLEVWKFVNLAIFATIGIYVLRKPIGLALAGRREAIKQELISAQAEREQAIAKVSEAEDLLTRVDEHVGAIHKQARQEADAERQRLAAATTREIDKLKLQAQREIESADKLARKELRSFLAGRSVELARDSVRSQLRPEDDALLIKENIGDLRRTTV